MVGKMDMPVNIPLRICFAIAFSDAAEGRAISLLQMVSMSFRKKNSPNAGAENGTKQRPILQINFNDTASSASLACCLQKKDVVVIQ
jgi:hypothetical protein